MHLRALVKTQQQQGAGEKEKHPPAPPRFPPAKAPPSPPTVISVSVCHLCWPAAQCLAMIPPSASVQTFVHLDMNIGTPGDTSSHPTLSVAYSTSPIFCSREETSERTMDYVDPSINEEVDNIENTDTIATDDDVQKPKRTINSHVWKHFEESKDQDGSIQLFCKHCKHIFKKPSTGATSYLGKHLKSCPVKLRADTLENRESLTQSHISFPTSSVDPLYVSAFDGKFDMEKIKVDVAKWIMIHEYAFSAVEDEWYTIMMKRNNPEWMPISRTTIKNQCVRIYESEKKKLKNEFKYVNKMSITTYCWKSKNKKIEYLCLEDWGIEDKIHTVSVANASANDSAIENLKVFIGSKKKLLCEGSLFHVRCYVHILNLVARDGLSEIKNVIECVRDSVDYIRRSDSRLKIFTKVVKQLNLREMKLIDDCKTRWNSTYKMLAIAIKFRDVFPRYADQDPCYLDCPSPSDWEKVVKVCSLLEVFWKATHVISGSYYPTSNLFLQEVVRVKVELDSKSQSSDDFIYNMVDSMKCKFDKYWGESNLLMATAAVLDPRYKMMALEFFFPKLYSPKKAATGRHLFIEHCMIFTPNMFQCLVLNLIRVEKVLRVVNQV
ncbi:hypothetical protein BUALT_Bualt01G0064400 [Buddleja alternifolia]|uniref:BED-type domain-containing protein n=1 Tax=Buddleja alternifolia TaxID=168488 RepID=A0AAV6YAY0_9LAMI|nr:hypothetical protein BUALT_Bualt01G0064400 [Buddleja alternifolia]